MPNVALCVFATGRYNEFFPQLIASARQYLLPGHRVDIVAFTDTANAPDGADQHVYYPHRAWPLGTLLRYPALAGQAEMLGTYDYILMCDVDMRFVDDVGPEILGPLIAVQHKGHLGKKPAYLPYVRNRKSTAFVKPGRGRCYYAGGLQGGSPANYLKACARMSADIEVDTKNGEMADWHDESHWNKYLVYHPPAIELPPPYCWGEPEGCPPGTKILALSKDHAAFRIGGEPLPTTLVHCPESIATEPGLMAAADALERDRLTSPLRERIVSTLRRMAQVTERANPRVYCAGGQHGLDEVLRALLPTDPVVYIDVGASEPVECSNTWQFYREGGHGLLIEPRPSCWYPILLQRPRDHLWPTAVARIDTWMELVECGASSSLAPQWTTDVRGRLTVQTLPLRHILDRFPDIRDQCQLLSLDIEGMEEHAIESLDWDATRPEVVVVEYHVQPRPDEDDMRANAIAELLARYDYAMVHRDKLNVVFRKATR